MWKMKNFHRISDWVMKYGIFLQQQQLPCSCEATQEYLYLEFYKMKKKQTWNIKQWNLGG